MEGARAMATFERMTDGFQIARIMKSMTPAEIATALERTRASFSQKAAEAYDYTVWGAVWYEITMADKTGRLSYAAPSRFVAESGMLKRAEEVCKLAYYYSESPPFVEFPLRELSMCLHYFAYLSNVYAYAAYKMEEEENLLAEGNQGAEAELAAEAVRKYHAEVRGTLEALTQDDQKLLNAVLIQRAGKRGGIDKKLFYRLFGEKASASGGSERGRGAALPLLYLPTELLFFEWTSINLDGRAFKLFLSMPEFTWLLVKHKRVLERVRVSHEQNALTLNLAGTSALSVISVQNGRLLSRNRASYIIGPTFAESMTNLTELQLVNLPSAVFPANAAATAFPKLQLFHIENVSRGRSVTAFISGILANSQKTLRKLVLAGPDLLVDPSMSRLGQLPGSVRSLTIKHLAVQVTDFPGVSLVKELDKLTLADLPASLSDIQYRMLTALSPKELTLDSLPISSGSFEEMLRVGDPDRLTLLNLVNMRNVWTLDTALEKKRKLKTLAITLPPDASPSKKLSVPIRTMGGLAKFTIGGVDAASVSTRLATATYTEWMRQNVVLGQAASASEAPKRRLSFDDEDDQPAIERDDAAASREREQEAVVGGADDSVTFEAIEQTLQDMYEPFGSKGPGQYPDRLPPASMMNNPDYPLAGLLMQTWLEWDEGIVAWLANEHGEGLLLDSAMGDISVTKRKIIDDGDVYAVEFSSKRSQTKPGAQQLNMQAEETLGRETEKFWTDLDSVTAPFPMRFELVCKERVIGRNNAPIIDGSVHLVYPCRDTRRFSTSAQPFSINSNVTEADFYYFRQRIGTLIREYETTPSGYRFITGFRLRLVLGQVVGMLATEDMMLLSTRSIGVVAAASASATKGKDAAADAESRVEADAEGLPVMLSAVSEGLLFPGREARFTPEEVVRHRVLTNILYTTSAIVKGVPFIWDEDNDRMLAAVQQEPERLMFGNWFKVAYCFSVGVSFVLDNKFQAGLREHCRKTLYENFLLPVAKWCLAYSPADRILESTVSSEESLISVEAAGDRLLALLKMMRSAVEDDATTAADLVSITTMLSPPVFGGEDDEDEQDQEDESVMQFVQAQSDFEDAVNGVLDNDHVSSAQFETRVGKNRRVFIDATKRLTDIYLDAQANHSGGGRFLDFEQMASFMRAEYRKAMNVFEAAERAIEAIKRDLSDEVQIDMQALSPLASSPSTRRSPSSEEERSPSFMSESPSPDKRRVVSPQTKKAKLVLRDESPEIVAARSAEKLAERRKSPVVIVLSPSPSPSPTKNVPARKRIMDTKLAVASASESEASSSTVRPLPPLTELPNQKPPLSGYSETDPIIIDD